MGRIISKVAALEKLSFGKLKKGQVYKNCEVIQITDGSFMAKKSNGEFVIAGGRSAISGNYAVLNYGMDEFSRSVLNGLVAIGALTKDEVAEHLNATKAAKAKREKQYTIDALRRNCEELGVPVPKVVDRMETKLKGGE